MAARCEVTVPMHTLFCIKDAAAGVLGAALVGGAGGAARQAAGGPRCGRRVALGPRQVGFVGDQQPRVHVRRRRHRCLERPERWQPHMILIQLLIQIHNVPGACAAGSACRLYTWDGDGQEACLNKRVS
jgi:hypothetical protein